MKREILTDSRIILEQYKDLLENYHITNLMLTCIAVLGPNSVDVLEEVEKTLLRTPGLWKITFELIDDKEKPKAQ